MGVCAARTWLPAEALAVTQDHLGAGDPEPALAYVRTLEDGRFPGATQNLFLDAFRDVDRGNWR